MFYLHAFGTIGARIRRTYDQFFYYRWCMEGLAALSDHAECTKNYERADYSVASSTLRCVSFAVVDQVELLQNLAALASKAPYKRYVVFDLSDLPWPTFRGQQVIVCKSAFHERFYERRSCVAIPQFPRYEFDAPEADFGRERPYLAVFKGDLRAKASMLRTQMLPLNNDRDIIIKAGVLTTGHIEFLSSGRATERTPPGELSYVDMLHNATFALLPRACGYALSYRMIESMNLGCIPVIISDGYVLPFSEILDYEKFSIRIPEGRIHDLPDILRERRRDAAGLQAESLRVYRDYFSSTAKIISHTLSIASQLD